MDARIQTIMEQWERDGVIRKQDRIVIGLSGGADSVCLLRLLCELRDRLELSLCAVHVHHGLRGEAADRDAAFAKQLCDRLAVTYKEVHYPVAQLAAERHMSVEETGRVLRYQCFEEIRQSLGYNKIAVAHHENDQAETVLLQMVRGTGLAGLSGMKQQEHAMIRPLLFVSRSEIEEILAAYGQPYCEDATNADVAYARNRIRNRVIGELEQVNSRAVPHIAAAARKVSLAQDCIRQICEEIYAAAGHDCRQEDGTRAVELKLDILQRQHVYLQHELVRMAIAALMPSVRDIGEVHIEAVRSLFASQAGRYVELPGGLRVYRNAGCLHFVCEGADLHLQALCLPVDLERVRAQQTVQQTTPQGQTLVVALTDERPAISDKKKYTKLLDCDKMKGNLVLRYPQKEDFLCIDACGHRKTLTKYMKDEKIPAYARPYQLVLADGHHIVWVIGYRISAYYHVGQDTRNVIKVTWMHNQTIQEGDDYDGR